MKHLKLVVAAAILLMTTSPAIAQSSGNIFGTVVDSDGAALPGVTVTLTGPAATQVFVTDGQGEFRFLGLAPGAYDLVADLSGFGSVTRSDVDVNIGRNTNVTLELNPALDETIVVTAETPLLDVRRTGTGATVTQVELDQVPTARDPWVILQQVPGVLMDRMNVGGNESGQQSNFASKGTDDTEATWNVDGVNTTDMIATGGSSSYYDFAAFEEIQITTGGTDPRVRTPGAQVNMVTKRGTNELSGSARYYLADGEWQDDAEIPAEAESYLQTVNSVGENRELGAEVGGPVVRDRLWLWGAYADQQVDIIPAQRVGDFVDATTLETINAKLNAQLSANNSLTGFWYRNEKIKLGRNLSLSRPVDAAWNQGSFGPQGTWKVEDTHIFSPNFFATGLYSKVEAGFQLIGTGPDDCRSAECAMMQAERPTFNFLEGAWQSGYLSLTNERPQEEIRADASTFFDLGSMGHELRYGVGHRTVATDTRLFWNGPGAAEHGGGYQTNLGQLLVAIGYNEEAVGYDLSPIIGNFVAAYAPYMYEYEYTDLYLGDTILWGDFTIQAGLRWDRQTGTLDPVQAPGVPGYDILPSITVSDLPDMPDWKTVSPRFGVTYAFGEENRTLLRGAYNEYVGQLGSNTTEADALLPFAYRYIYNYGIDSNGNGYVDAEEVLQDGDHPACGEFVRCGTAPFFFGFDINNPISTGTPITRLDPDVNPPSTQEFLLGIEHEILPNFVVGATYTHREIDDFIQFAYEKTPGSGDFFSAADYELVGMVGPGEVACGPDSSDCQRELVGIAGNYSIPLYQLKESVVDEFGAPTYRVMRNRPGYSQTFDGVDFTAVKRLSNRWMLRGSLSLMDWSQSVGPDSFQDPTPRTTDLNLSFTSGCAGAPEYCDGQTVVSGAGTNSGEFANVWVGSDWSYSIAGLYEIPVIETNLGFNLNGREGYPIVYNHEVTTITGFSDLLIGEIGEYRLDDLHQLDLRLSKDLSFQQIGLQLSLDVFNVLNDQTILQREAELVDRVGATPTFDQNANHISEIRSPRILRLGARLTF